MTHCILVGAPVDEGQRRPGCLMGPAAYRVARLAETLVAIEGAEATLKRYRRKGGMIALEAANPAYETRMLPEDKVRVQGRLVGLIRSY